MTNAMTRRRRKTMISKQPLPRQPIPFSFGGGSIQLVMSEKSYPRSDPASRSRDARRRHSNARRLKGSGGWAFPVRNTRRARGTKALQFQLSEIPSSRPIGGEPTNHSCKVEQGFAEASP